MAPATGAPPPSLGRCNLAVSDYVELLWVETGSRVPRSKWPLPPLARSATLLKRTLVFFLWG